MASSAAETLRELMQPLKGDDLKDRLMAIQMLGEIDDAAALEALWSGWRRSAKKRPH